MNRAFPVIAWLLLIVSTCVFLPIVLSGPAYRFGFWELGTAFDVVKKSGVAAVWIGGFSVIFCVANGFFYKRLSKRGLAAICLSVLPLIPLLLFKQTAGSVPPIHDITTDTINPPAFVDVAPLRIDAPNPVDYLGGEVTEQQLEAYPDIVPIDVDLTLDQVYPKALKAAQSMGWDMIADVPEAGRIEATDTTFWFGYKDDVVIRITDSDTGARIDVRSKSRVGGSDVGMNAKRIRGYREQLLNLL